MKRIRILGCNVDVGSRENYLNAVDDLFKNKKTNWIVTANAEMYYAAAKDPELKNAINTADLCIPDSVGIRWAAQYKGHQQTAVLPGVELAELFINKKYLIYVLGAKQEVIDRLDQPNIVGRHNGYFDKTEESAIIKDINHKKPQVLFVGLGAGKQELWINKYRPLLNVQIIIGIGGAIDVLSGYKKRAPLFWRSLQLEWLYRLLKEPSRITRQYKLLLYLLAVIKE